jgi:ribosomal protein S11
MKFICAMAGVADIEFLCPAGRAGPSAAKRALAQSGKRNGFIAEITKIPGKG